MSFRSLVCDGKKGLLTRLLTVMKREPPDSSFRWDTGFITIWLNMFWNARWVMVTYFLSKGSGRQELLRASSEGPHHMQTRCFCWREACWRYRCLYSRFLCLSDWSKCFFPIEFIELLKSCLLIVAHPLLHHRQWLQVQRCPAELLWPARGAYEVQHRCLQEIQQIRQHRWKGTGNNKMWRNKSCC